MPLVYADVRLQPGHLFYMLNKIADNKIKVVEKNREAVKVRGVTVRGRNADSKKAPSGRLSTSISEVVGRAGLEPATN